MKIIEPLLKNEGGIIIRKINIPGNIQKYGDNNNIAAICIFELYKKSDPQYKDQLLILPQGNAYKIYENHGQLSHREALKSYYIPGEMMETQEIILPTTKPDADLFLTDMLSGCFTGVYIDKGDHIHVFHINETDFKKDDIIRFSDECKCNNWLIPYKKKQNYIQKKFLCGYSIGTFFKNNPLPKVYEYKDYNDTNKKVSFWGEYEDDKWNFYYQTTDLKIHNFIYQ